VRPSLASNRLLRLLFEALCPFLHLSDLHTWPILTRITWFDEFSVQPFPLGDGLIIHKVSAIAGYEPILELADVLAVVFQEKIPLSMFFKVVNLTIVYLTLRVLNLSIANHIVLPPIPSNRLAWRKDQRAFPVELISQTVANVFKAVQKLEMPLHLQAVLIDASISWHIYLKVTPLL
jgi:hypothetical protein